MPLARVGRPDDAQAKRTGLKNEKGGEHREENRTGAAEGGLYRAGGSGDSGRGCEYDL